MEMFIFGLCSAVIGGLTFVAVMRYAGYYMLFVHRNDSWPLGDGEHRQALVKFTNGGKLVS